MLYITTKNKKLIQWFIGENSFSIQNSIDDIQTIMASGPELDLIKERFSTKIWVGGFQYDIYSIPMPQGSDIIWHGDIAKIIVSNIMI